MRLIITGSRRFPAPHLVHAALDNALHDLPFGDHLTVIHGACLTGADMAAHRWTQRAIRGWGPVTEEPHPADWAGLGKKAGGVRNAAMVDAGADRAIAFLDDSPCTGTRDTIRRAHRAGIPVREVRP